MAFPVVASGEVGAAYSYTEQFADEFEGTGSGPGPYWTFDTLDDALNRTGNQGMDASGNASSGSVPGKRWAAWTNGPNDEIVYRQDGKLYIGGKVENISDPTRENYTHNGTTYNWGDYRFYSPYMVQWGRKYSSSEGGHITDTATPNIYMGPGHYIEIRLSVEQMRTPGFRVSLWLTPIIPNESLAYDEFDHNGVEIDILEIEKWSNGGYGNNRVQSKVLGGLAGNTLDQGGGNIDASSFNIIEGFHTYGLLWLSTGLYWYIDGVETIREVDVIPLSNHFLSLTRELNAGVKDAAEANGTTDIPSNGIKRPVDVGLYNISAFPYKDGIKDDKAIVDYIRVWSVDGEGGNFNGPDTATTGGETGGTTEEVDTSGGSTTTATPLNPRLVIYTQPAIREGRPMQELVAVPFDGYDVTGKTFTWSSSLTELTFSPQGTLVTTPSVSGLTSDQLSTVTIDDGEE